MISLYVGINLKVLQSVRLPVATTLTQYALIWAVNRGQCQEGQCRSTEELLEISERRQQQSLLYVSHPHAYTLDTPKTMAAVATTSSIFALFSSLPLELRDQIWRAALPDEIPPALYFYKKGGWCPTDENDPENDESNVNFKYRHDLLDVVQLEVPLFFVSREARRIALAWVREHGIEIRAREDRRSPVFVCPFNPVRDVLYIAVDKWNEFLCEPHDRMCQPDMVEKYIHSEAVNITRIAIPEELFRGEGEVAAAIAEIMVVTISFSFLCIFLTCKTYRNSISAYSKWCIL